MFTRIGTSVILVVLALSTSTASAGITAYLTVDIGIKTGLNNGAGWANAYRDADGLQDALDEAESLLDGLSGIDKVEIWIAEGRYLPSVATERGVARTKTFMMIADVKFKGGYESASGGLPARDVDTYPTFLDGDLDGDDPVVGWSYGSDNVYHVITVDESATNVVLDGIVIRGGRADRPDDGGTNHIVDRQGAGVTNRDQDTADTDVINNDLTVTNCRFKRNWSDNHGALNDHGVDTVITDTTFWHNHSDNKGGCYYAHIDATPTITDCIFEACTAKERGAAIYCNEAAPDVDDCVFITNVIGATATGGAPGGAAIYIVGQPDGGGVSTIDDCVFAENISGDDDGGGGAIYLLDDGTDGADVEITNCTFTGNTSELYGGGFFSNASYAEIKDCRFIDEFATDAGGAMNSTAAADLVVHDSVFIANTASGGFSLGGAWVSDTTSGGTTAFVRSTFVGNYAAGGSAIWYKGNEVFVDNCLLAMNQGTSTIYQLDSGEDEALYVRNSTIADSDGIGVTASDDAEVYNSIVWGNGDLSEEEQTDGMTVVSYNTIEDWTAGGTGGTGNTATDPDLMADAGNEYSGTWDDDDAGSDDDADYLDPTLVATGQVDEAAQTTYTFVTWPASFPAGSLAGMIFQPNASDGALDEDFTVVVSSDSTAKTLTVWGDYTAHLDDGDTFNLLDYRLDSSSAAIDAGEDDEAAGVCSSNADCVKLGYTTCTSGYCVDYDIDLDGNDRFVDCAAGTDDVDMGAYEDQCP